MGGGGISTFDASRVRVVAAAGALAVALLLGVLPAVYGGDRRRVLLVLAIGGVLIACTALSGRARAIPWAVATLGAEYAVFLVGRDTIDLRAPVFGAALFVFSELTYGSLRARSAAPTRGQTSLRHVADLGALCLGAVALGSIVVAAGAVGLGRGLALSLAGAVACAGVVGLVFVLTRRPAGLAGPDAEDG